jgi:hypothetical protein
VTGGLLCDDDAVPRVNAINEGFRAVVRMPSLLLAELAWRWSFGLAAMVLIGIGVREVQHAVTLSPTDELLLGSMQPMLMGEAWAHILRQTLPLLFKLAAILLPALSVMWVAAATLGRAVTIRRVLDHFAASSEDAVAERKIRWGAMTALHAFRATVMLAVFLGYLGAGVVASRFVNIEEGKPPSLDAAWVVFVMIFAVVVIVAAGLNWVLSLAPVFVVRDGRGTWESMGDAVKLFRERGSQLTAAATWNGFLRFVGACVASVAGLFPLMLIGEVRGIVVWMLVGIITVMYCVISDWLLLARLASYVAVVEQGSEQVEVVV